MLYHMGVLDGPNSRTLKWLKTGTWDRMAPELQHELDVALLTPGFTTTFWANILGRSVITVAKRKRGIHESLRDEALANWNSVTAEDARALAQMRAAGTHMPIPSRLQLLADIKAGLSWSAAAIQYQVTDETINQIRQHPFGAGLPDWFRGTIPAI